MLKSMTGYGRAQRMIAGRDITVEIKSVNHRYFEFSARVPRTCGYLEEKLKSFLYGPLSRGKVDVYVSILSLEDSAARVEVNLPLARSYLEALRVLGRELALVDDINLARLAGFGDIFALRKVPEDENAVWEAVRSVAEEALGHMVGMREAEGARMRDDLLTRLDLLEGYTAQIEERAPALMEAYRQRLFAKLGEILADRQIDEQRVLTEAAIFAEKTAVDEETVRLRSHIEGLRQFLSQEDAVGRKMDFLVQELNRETNTIGSKAQDLEIARFVVEMKSEIEKIREQIQNIE